MTVFLMALTRKPPWRTFSFETFRAHRTAVVLTCHPHPGRMVGRLMGRPLGISLIILLYPKIVADADIDDGWLLLKNAFPLVINRGWMFEVSTMAVIPFLAGNFSADAVGHNTAVMGAIADGKSVRFKPTCTSAKNRSVCLEKILHLYHGP